MGFKKSKEQQVLLNLLKGEFPSHLEEVDVKQLFKLFQRHRLLPLASAIAKLLDEPNRNKWKNRIHTLNLRSLHQTSELTSIIRGFKNDGIELIPLKGPVLAQNLYGDVNQRHGRDLDLLINKGDLFKALEVAKKLGFELYSPNKQLSGRAWNYYFRFKYDIGLIHHDQSIFIELHTRILYPKLLGNSEEIITNKLVTVKLAGDDIQWLTKNNTFLYLSIHGAHHRFFRLFWLRDIAEVIKKWDLDHIEILITAKKLGLERLLGVSLELAADFFDIEIPDAYKKFLENDARIMKRLKRLCERAILGPGYPTIQSRFETFYFYLSLKPGYIHKKNTITSVFHRWWIRSFFGGR